MDIFDKTCFFKKKIKIKFDLPVNCNDNLTLEKEEIILGCCSCKYLNENKKIEGRVNGSLYYCSKLKTYVNGASGSCDNYFIDHGRKIYTRDEIYDDGKKYYNDTTPVGFYLVVLIILIILGLFLGVFN